MLGKLTMENYLLKKEKEFIAARKKESSSFQSGPSSEHLKEVLALMKMSKSTYCYKPKDKDEKIKRDRDLCKKIRARKFPYYGYRRITQAL